MELFESNVLAIHAPPDEIDNQFEGLWEQLNPNYANVSQESSEALSVALVNIDAGESVRHLSTFVVGDDFEVVSLIA